MTLIKRTVRNIISTSVFYAEKVGHATVVCRETAGLEIPLESTFYKSANDDFLVKMQF